MPKLATRNQELVIRVGITKLFPSFYFLVSNTWVQVVYSRTVRGGTTTRFAHRPGFQPGRAGYKSTVYAQASVQTLGTKRGGYAQYFTGFNRLYYKVIPALHRAYSSYYYLIKYIINRKRIPEGIK